MFKVVFNFLVSSKGRCRLIKYLFCLFSMMIIIYNEPIMGSTLLTMSLVVLLFAMAVRQLFVWEE